MSMSSVIKWTLCIVGAVVISVVATWETESLVTRCCPHMKTPGDLVMNWLMTQMGPVELKLGYAAVVIFGVDFLLCFGLILGLIALFTWRFGKSR